MRAMRVGQVKIITAVTYDQAKRQILDALDTLPGWTVKKDLKIPWADNRNVKIWFKRQAIYRCGSGVPFGAARSLSYDHKELLNKSGGDPDTIEELLTKR